MPPWMWIVLVAVILAVLFIVWAYNRLVSLKQRGDGAWSDIDVQLKRRWELVPALVSTVEGYARHEKETLTQAVEARNHAKEAGTIPERDQTERTLKGSVDRLFALAEAYPDLKANQNFLELHRNLVDIEDHLQSSRRYYNAVVRDYNTAIQSFPAVLLAGPLGFSEREFFQLDSAAERAAPGVKLG